ncbi:MAG: ATP-binding protein [Calditerrivibrio sp.]|nr:ATP-binding protein [Calditerrivibrio sp.]
MKIFLKYLLLLSTSLIAVILFSVYVITSALSKDILNDRVNTLRQYSTMLYKIYPEKGQYNYLNIDLKNILASLEVRVTIVDKDGAVRYDSTFFSEKDLLKVENHAGRKEVVDALKVGEGFDVRLSSTLGVKYIYYAKLINDEYILRLSLPLINLETYAKDLKYQLMMIFVAVVGMIFMLTYYFTKKLLLPIENLNELITKAEKGEKIDIQKYTVFSDEISTLVTRFYNNMLLRERAIAEEKNRIHFILSSLSDSVALFDENWELVYGNEKYKELFCDSLKDAKDYECIKLFNELKNKDDGKHFCKYKNRIYEISIKSSGNYKIIVFHDSSDQMRYHAFKSELVANVSHELKTPVSIIMGYAETLLNNEMDQNTREKFLKKLYDSSVRLDNLIADIIQLHSLESSDRNFSVERGVYPSELMSELEEIYRDAVKKIHYNFDDSEVKVLKEHLLSIFKNLIDNALTYSTGNNVYVSLVKSESKIVLSVEDEGPVIPDEEKGKIFERFYTSSRSRNRKHSGTGLGLSIVKHTAELYGGYVELIKSVYGGNCFKVVLKEK